MKSTFTKQLFLAAFVLFSLNGFSQSTFGDIYQIFQTNCTFSSCHDDEGPAFGLNLKGTGPGAMMEVYDNIVGVTPNNSTAEGKNNKIIMPGDPSRSFMFRKIQHGLDASLTLDPGENEPMPLFGSPLSDKKIELVRQWILHGAPATGTVIDTNLIAQYYDNNGVQSVSNPPAMPDPSEGFQIHLGPFFVPPGQEKEVFIKHNLFLQDNIEVTAIETHMGLQSHHFILNRFLAEEETLCGVSVGAEGPDAFPDGFRGVDDPSHFSALFQVGAQQTGRLELPYKTAFAWDAGTIIDLNSHYINANATQVLSADVYINVYYQEDGIAVQDMQALMVPNTSINLPSTGETITLTQNLPLFLCFPSGMFLYALNSHTHKLGIDYDIYKSDAAGQNVEHLFDASCFQDAVPGCVDEFYDYQHPPERQFPSYYPLTGGDWLKHEAKYVNNTGQNVGWGLTSNDEMMIMFMFYVTDTTGLINFAPEVGADEASTNEGESITISVLENDTDIDGVSVCGIASPPDNGEVTINEDGTITYTPDEGFSGVDQFEYTACDLVNNPLSTDGTVTVTVNAPSSVLNQNIQHVKVYPNPTSGAVMIAMNSQEIRSIQLLNIQGQWIQNLSYNGQGGILSTDLKAQNIPNGMYWLVIEGNDNLRKVAKVILMD
jgi:hypothetical protein